MKVYIMLKVDFMEFPIALPQYLPFMNGSLNDNATLK